MMQADMEQRREAALMRLAAAQQRAETGPKALTEAMAGLTEARRHTQQMNALITTQRHIEALLGKLDGRTLARTYREQAGAYFGRLLRRARVVAPQSLEDELEARVSREAFHDVLLLDLIVAGQPRDVPGAKEVLVAVEVSVVVDAHDVERARRRAAVLRDAGYRAVPAVAGERLTAGAEGALRDAPALVLLDGRVEHWEAALASLGD